MIAPGQSTIVLVAGHKQSGKTRLVKRGLARLRRWVVWDVKGEYASPPFGVAGARLWTDMRLWREHLLDGGTIEREVFACPASQFPAWCRWVAQTGNLVVVIEELARYCGGAKPPPYLADLYDRSRHLHIDLVATTARVTRVHSDLRAQVDELVVSRHTEPNDCAYLRDWLGEPAVTRIRNLQPQRFVRVRP